MPMNSIGSSWTTVAQGWPAASMAPTSASGSCTTPPVLARISVRSSSALALARRFGRLPPALAAASAGFELVAGVGGARPFLRSAALVSYDDWAASG